MRPLCEGVPSIRHLISIPPKALTPQGTIRFHWLLFHGVNPLLPADYRVHGRDGQYGVPETANQDFERKCQLFDAYNAIALRTQFLVKSIRHVKFGPPPPWDPDGDYPRDGSMTHYAFVPWMVARRGVPHSEWSQEPASALGEAIETMRSITVRLFPSEEAIRMLPLDDERKAGMRSLLRMPYLRRGIKLTKAQIIERDLRLMGDEGFGNDNEGDYDD